MKSSKILTSLLSLLILSACSSAQLEYVNLESKTIDAGNAQSMLIQMDNGELAISGAGGGQMELGGRAVYPHEVEHKIDYSGDQIRINIQDRHRGPSKNHVQLNMTIPNGIKVKVESDNASVLIQGYSGDLEVASTSGNVVVENTAGNLVLRSNRGNVTVRESSGTISVVGNYGALNVHDVHGETAMSTIMGNVLFDGLIQAGDVVRLETDHGAVSVNLNQDSAASLQVRSTSGDVACMLPNVVSSTRTCDGEIGSGGGELSIRTVSGAVTLQLIP